MSSNLYTCQRLTSGDKPVISLVNGFGYAGGTTPAVFKEYDFAILNTHFSALAWVFDVHVNGSFILGFGGPGWGTGMYDNELNIGNTSDNRTVSLGGGGPYTEAGFLFGAQLKFNIHVQIKAWKGVRWVGGWHGHFENIWGTITDATSEATLDLIQLILAGIEYLVNRGQGGPLAEITRKLKPAEGVPHAGWGLLDSTTEPLKAVAEGSTTDLLPQLTVRLDLSQFITPIRVFNEALSKIGSGVQFGPTFGIGLPLHVQVEGVVVDNAVFGVSGRRSASAKNYYDSTQGNVISGRAASNLATAGYRPTRVGLRYKWSWGLDITVGVYCKISIFYVLSVSPEFHFGLLALLGINTNTQSGIRGDLTNSSFAYQQQVARDVPQPLEFVFD